MAVLWWEMAQDVHLSLLPASTSLMFAAQVHLSLSGDHLLSISCPLPAAVHSSAQEALRMLLKVWETIKRVLRECDVPTGSSYSSTTSLLP